MRLVTHAARERQCDGACRGRQLSRADESATVGPGGQMLAGAFRFRLACGLAAAVGNKPDSSCPIARSKQAMRRAVA
jgi:hypothetical protein